MIQVVAKLFNIIQPDLAMFGEKDYQQLQVVTAMTRALSMGVKIIPCPTVRESDGLAMSSRNVYLDIDQRRRALALISALRETKRLFDADVRDPTTLEAAMARILDEHGCKTQYAVVRDAATLKPLTAPDLHTGPGAGCAGAHWPHHQTGVIALIAAYVDHVRLIDNLRLM